MELTYKSGKSELLWKPLLQPVYLFCGEEDRLKEEALAALVKKIVSADFADFDMEAFEARAVGADEIVSAAAQAPFGSERRLVVVHGMEQWRDRARQAEAERLAERIPRLPETACLVLMAAAEEDEARRKIKVSAKLDQAVKKLGAFVTCDALKGENLAEWVQSRCRAAGKKMESAVAEQLTQAVGNEMLALEHEIDKLVSYVGSRERITERDVALCVASSPEDVMFATVDAITRRQTDTALTLLGELHRFDPKPQAVAGKLMGVLSRQYRMLWQAKFLAEKRINPREVRSLPADLLAELPSEASIVQLHFKANELFTAARGYSWSELTRALDMLLLFDLANKGGATDETGVFSADPVRNLQILTLELTGKPRIGTS